MHMRNISKHFNIFFILTLEGVNTDVRDLTGKHLLEFVM